MQIESAVELLENAEYMKDGKGFDTFVKGVQLIAKYSGDNSMAAEHDIIYLAEFNEEMTEADICQLSRWGFHLDTEVNSWAYFT